MVSSCYGNKDKPSTSYPLYFDSTIIADKTMLILYQGSRGGPLFSRVGGVKLFPGGGGSKC